MSKIYAVSSGEYSDYFIMKVFSSLEAAERYIVQYNKSCPKYDDEAFLEIMDLDDGKNIMPFHVYRYIYFSFSTVRNVVSWSMEFRDQPIDKLEMKHNYICYEGVIPVTRTYDDRNEKDCALVEKLVQDAIAKYRAEQAGL